MSYPPHQTQRGPPPPNTYPLSQPVFQQPRQPHQHQPYPQHQHQNPQQQHNYPPARSPVLPQGQGQGQAYPPHHKQQYRQPPSGYGYNPNQSSSIPLPQQPPVQKNYHANSQQDRATYATNNAYDSRPRRQAPPPPSHSRIGHTMPRSPQAPYPSVNAPPNHVPVSSEGPRPGNQPQIHGHQNHQNQHQNQQYVPQRSPQLPYPSDQNAPVYSQPQPQQPPYGGAYGGAYAPPQTSHMPVPPPAIQDASGRASPITLAQRRMQPTPTPVYTQPSNGVPSNGAPSSAELAPTEYQRDIGSAGSGGGGYAYAHEAPNQERLRPLPPHSVDSNSYYDTNFSPRSVATTATSPITNIQPLKVAHKADPNTPNQDALGYSHGHSHGQSNASSGSSSSSGLNISSDQRPPPRRNYSNTTADPLNEATEKPKVLTVDEFERVRQQAANRPQDSKLQLELAKKYIEASDVLPMRYTDPNTPANGGAQIFDTKYESKNREVWTKQALKIVKKLAQAHYPDALFYLGSNYSSAGMGLELDYDKAYELYFKAADRDHAEAAYRVAVCNEIGVGTRRDPQKAISWYKKASLLGDVSAMYKLGMISLNGLLGQPKNFMEAVTWLQRAAEKADKNTPHAVHELGLLYERGDSTAGISGGAPVISKDEKKAFDLFVKAARLGYPPSMFRLGSCYEYGTLGCNVDPKRSIAWYSRAAEKGDPESELALSGWYLTGSEGILRQSDTEAYLWARKAAEKGISKAEYALGYFSEVGIGIKTDIEEAKKWYHKAAVQRHPKAIARIKELRDEEF